MRIVISDFRSLQGGFLLEVLLQAIPTGLLGRAHSRVIAVSSRLNIAQTGSKLSCESTRHEPPPFAKLSPMFGLSMAHMILLGALALIVIGPKQLPEVARTLGRFLNEIKRVTSDVTKTIVEARDLTDEDLKKSATSPYTPKETLEAEAARAPAMPPTDPPPLKKENNE